MSPAVEISQENQVEPPLITGEEDGRRDRSLELDHPEKEATSVPCSSTAESVPPIADVSDALLGVGSDEDEDKEQVDPDAKKYDEEEAAFQAFLEKDRPKKKLTLKERLMMMPGYDKIIASKPQVGAGLGSDDEIELEFETSSSSKDKKKKKAKTAKKIDQMIERLAHHICPEDEVKKPQHFKIHVNKVVQDSEGMPHAVTDEIDYVAAPEEEVVDILANVNKTTGHSPRGREEVPGEKMTRLKEALLVSLRKKKVKEYEEKMKLHALYNEEKELEDKDEQGDDDLPEDEILDDNDDGSDEEEDEDEEEEEEEDENAEDSEEEEEITEAAGGRRKKMRRRLVFVEDEAEDEDEERASESEEEIEESQDPELEDIPESGESQLKPTQEDNMRMIFPSKEKEAEQGSVKEVTVDQSDFSTPLFTQSQPPQDQNSHSPIPSPQMQEIPTPSQPPGITDLISKVGRDINSQEVDVYNLCSGKFPSQAIISTPLGVDNDDEDEEDEPVTKKVKPIKRKRLQFSDDEDEPDLPEQGNEGEQEQEEENEEMETDDINEGDDDEEDEEAEYERQLIKEKEIPKARGLFGKNGKLKKKFVEDEAELSGSEEGSGDEDERGLNFYEEEEGDEEDLDEDEVKKQLERAHLKRMLDDDDRQIRDLQDEYLGGDLGEEKQRERKFRWNNMDDPWADDAAMMGGGSDGEGEGGAEETEEDIKQKLEDIEKRKWIHENSHVLEATEEESQKSIVEKSKVLKLGKSTMKKIESFVDSSTSSFVINNETSNSGLDNFSITALVKSKIKGNPKNFLGAVDKDEADSLKLCKRTSQPLFASPDDPTSKIKRGSFLSRGSPSLSKLAEFTKVNDAKSDVKSNSRNFVFSVVTPPDQPSKQNKSAKRPPNNSQRGQPKKFIKIDRSFSNLDESSQSASIFKWM